MQFTILYDGAIFCRNLKANNNKHLRRWTRWISGILYFCSHSSLLLFLKLPPPLSETHTRLTPRKHHVVGRAIFAEGKSVTIARPEPEGLSITEVLDAPYPLWWQKIECGTRGLPCKILFFKFAQNVTKMINNFHSSNVNQWLSGKVLEFHIGDKIMILERLHAGRTGCLTTKARDRKLFLIMDSVKLSANENHTPIVENFRGGGYPEAFTFKY